jgi:hypothetical protein
MRPRLGRAKRAHLRFAQAVRVRHADERVRRFARAAGEQFVGGLEFAHREAVLRERLRQRGLAVVEMQYPKFAVGAHGGVRCDDVQLPNMRGTGVIILITVKKSPCCRLGLGGARRA